MNPQDLDLINQVADQRLGKRPEAQMPPQGMPPQAPPQKPQASQEPTKQEKIVEKAAPKDEGAKAKDEAMTVYDVEFGENDKRQLTAAQIKSTFDRYSNMNYNWQQMKPITDLASKMMESAKRNGKSVSADEVAKFMDSAARAYVQNAQFGNSTEKSRDGQIKPDGVPDKESQQPMGKFTSFGGDAELSKWERDNAVSLPPKYKESLQNFSAMEQRIAQLEQMLKSQGDQMSQGMGNDTRSAMDIANKAMQAANEAKTNNQQAIRQQVMNNLSMAQQKFNLPDDSEQDFMSFIMQRGYTPMDFVDPELTMTVAQDFANFRMSPEMERLRGIAQRRQSFTGNIQGAPAGAGSAPAQGGDAFFNQMVGDVMAKKFR